MFGIIMWYQSCWPWHSVAVSKSPSRVLLFVFTINSLKFSQLGHSYLRMPHTKNIRRFTRPRAVVNDSLGRYIIRLTGKDLPEFLTDQPIPETESERPPKTPQKNRKSLGPLMPLTDYYLKQRRDIKSKMRMVNIEFKSLERDKCSDSKDGKESKDDKETVQHVTTTLTFSDYLCKWCLAYVGQRRQFCSADCAAQFKLCQKRRDQKQVCWTCLSSHHVYKVSLFVLLAESIVHN